MWVETFTAAKTQSRPRREILRGERVRCALNEKNAIEWTLHFDGACHGNGTARAKAGYGWLIQSDHGTIVASGYGSVTAKAGEEPVTNNVAEWMAVIEGLHWLACCNIASPDVLNVYGDSALVVNQFNGAWKCKQDRMKELCRRGMSIADKLRRRGIQIDAAWIPREQNTDADALSTKGVHQ